MSRKAMLREVGRYVVAVVGLSAAVNFGLVTVLEDYDSTLDKAAAVAAAAVAAALVAWFVSTRVLRIGAADLESVRKHQAGLQSFRSMRRIEASRRNASALRLRFSQSFASLRQRLSQAKVRSTIQRRGSTTNPFVRSERLTISVSSCGKIFAKAF